jgi:hypothetical protein
MMRFMEPRRRAPRRAGHRTTLTVPHSVLDAAQRLARELGTSPNDAIVRLAEEGAAARERRARIASVARERRAAVERVELPENPTLASPAEVREAILAGRHRD